MTRYRNGYVPDSALKTIATGTDSNGPWKHQGSPHIIALWAAMQAYAQRKWGKTPKIRSGWNIYRPYAIQVAARQRACALGNCLGAASPGYSSHGGTWINKSFTGGVWVDALAIDVDPNGLTWDQVWEAGRAVGFLCGAITTALAGMEEPWHIIDLSPWDAVPTDNGSTPFPLEDDMTPEQATQLNSIFNAIFRGGESMPDNKQSIGQSLADLQAKLAPISRGGALVSVRQEIADAKTNTIAIQSELGGATTPAPALSDADVERIATKVADIISKRMAS